MVTQQTTEYVETQTEYIAPANSHFTIDFKKAFFSVMFH